MSPRTFSVLCGLLGAGVLAHGHGDHDGWLPQPYAPSAAHAPRPLPDRIILTWSDDPATTQSVTWRTDVSVKHGYVEYAVANDNGRALQPVRVAAGTSAFRSDLNEAHYHSATLRDLAPETLYAYRVGDGVNWSEYFHFRTASAGPQAFSFVYFGDAQNDIKTHWSRVFREAFREAPRAAFALHAGDLINDDDSDAQWGEWHGAPAWVNATVPVIAAAGNHEYFRENPGPAEQRLWSTRSGGEVPVTIEAREVRDASGAVTSIEIKARSADGPTAGLRLDGSKYITGIDAGVTAITGFSADDLVGTELDKRPLRDRARDPGTPRVSRHWRPQFAFPVADVPEAIQETCYFVDYQGTRIIVLDSNRDQEAQVGWLRRALSENPRRWTIVTFHHPIFSPARDRDNAALRALWKPVFDEFKVDLVLTGHDHTYARSGVVAGSVSVGETNVTKGYNQVYDPAIGTVYVVSVSGPKMYDLTSGEWAVRKAEDTQLFQVITVDGDELHFEARTATNRLYDAFTLRKRSGRANELIELLPKENRRDRSPAATRESKS